MKSFLNDLLRTIILMCFVTIMGCATMGGPEVLIPNASLIKVKSELIRVNTAGGAVVVNSYALKNGGEKILIGKPHETTTTEFKIVESPEGIKVSALALIFNSAYPGARMVDTYADLNQNSRLQALLDSFKEHMAGQR